MPLSDICGSSTCNQARRADNQDNKRFKATVSVCEVSSLKPAWNATIPSRHRGPSAWSKGAGTLRPACRGDAALVWTADDDSHNAKYGNASKAIVNYIAEDRDVK